MLLLLFLLLLLLLQLLMLLLLVLLLPLPLLPPPLHYIFNCFYHFFLSRQVSNVMNTTFYWNDNVGFFLLFFSPQDGVKIKTKKKKQKTQKERSEEAKKSLYSNFVKVRQGLCEDPSRRFEELKLGQSSFVMCCHAVLRDSALWVQSSWASSRRDFSLGVNMGSDSIPPNSFGGEYKLRSSLCTHAFHCTNSKDPDIPCPRRVNAFNKNTHSMHHPWRQNVTTSNGWITKWSHSQKITHNGEPQSYSWGMQKKKKKKD